MGYLILQILLCLILAGVLGFLVGWLLKIWPNKDKISELEKKIDLLEKSISERNFAIDDEIKEVKENYTKTNNIVSSLEGRIDLLEQLSEKYSALENQLKTNLLDKNYDSLIGSMDDKLNTLETKITELAGKDYDVQLKEIRVGMEELDNKLKFFVSNEDMEEQFNRAKERLGELEGKLNEFYSKEEVDFKLGEMVAVVAGVKDELEEKKVSLDQLNTQINELYSKPETDAKNDLINTRIKELEDLLNSERTKTAELESKLNSFYEKPVVDGKLDEYFAKCSELENRFNSEIEKRDKTIAGLEAKLDELSKKEPPKPRIDDLTKISGIGNVLEKMLHEQGIYSYEQIAKLTEEEVDRLDEFLKFHDRIRRENWREQARRLHLEKYGEGI